MSLCLENYLVKQFSPWLLIGVTQGTFKIPQAAPKASYRKYGMQLGLKFQFLRGDLVHPELQTIPVKGQILNITGFVAQTVSVITTLLCRYIWKAVR